MVGEGLKKGDYSKILSVLDANKDKNFVKRILQPDIYPVMPLDDNKYGTHMMRSAESDGRGIAYPEIVMDENGKLKRLTGRDAWNHAVRTGEYIEFPTPEEADWFGQNYKRVWGVEGRQAGGFVPAGKPVMVGETGREGFVPLSNIARPYLSGEESEIVSGGDMGEFSPKDQPWQPAAKYYGQPMGVFEVKGHPTHSGWYDAGAAKIFADRAKAHGVDPLLYVALGVSESRMGKDDPYNLPRVMPETHAEALEKLYQRKYWSEGFPDSDQQSLDLIDYGARYLAEGIKNYPNDLLSGVQSYSGVGKKPYGGRTDPNEKFFNKKAKDTNFWRDKPQAKRVLAIYNILKKNPKMAEIIADIE